jgi:hypothetical protein
MIKNYIVLLIILLGYPELGLSQPVFRFGPELGTAFSRVPSFKSYYLGFFEVEEKTLPIGGTVAAIHSELTFDGRFLTTLGLQYQHTGQRHFYYAEEVNGFIPNNTNVRSESIWEDQTYHKLALQLTAGYAFKLGHARVSAYVGIRPNLFLSGKHRYEILTQNTDGTFRGHSMEYDPVDPSQIQTPIERVSRQVLAGISTTVGKSLKLNLSFNKGEKITYFQFDPFSGSNMRVDSDNSELMISAAWLLTPSAGSDHN